MRQFLLTRLDITSLKSAKVLHFFNFFNIPWAFQNEPSKTLGAKKPFRALRKIENAFFICVSPNSRTRLASTNLSKKLYFEIYPRYNKCNGACTHIYMQSAITHTSFEPIR
jgi:hypothetical protein